MLRFCMEEGLGLVNFFKSQGQLPLQRTVS
ncbi:rCG44562 [Rattus norvegicus]|uniref:RCG44562 n=1 Tax=Rattus norvegicus TaxID=10116 RepID=A6I5C3_RAT|nr:rCG44562 [Rattus norvegicus]